tara:strand:- start:203 stop:505 length:303 start_codon:yes stop_codon:yes gene_type:complete
MAYISKDNFDSSYENLQDSVVAVRNYFKFVIPEKGNKVSKDDIRYLQARISSISDAVLDFMASDYREQFKIQDGGKAFTTAYMALDTLCNLEKHNLTYKE